ncbi:MAG: GGDEF domain-containing protein [Gemmatimonadales bacterium]|nr:GGDEF domain-containing protein [Gemmatimonadales bacterium]
MISRFYRGPAWWPLGRLRTVPGSAGMRRVLVFWLSLSTLAITSALLEAKFDWSGMPISAGGLTVGLTIYPPVLFTVPLALWLGPVWGALPAYFATLASAVSSGMPIATSALFALSTPLEILILWGSMVTLDIHPDLERWGDVRRYLLVGLIAPTASSLAALIWNNVHQLDLIEGQRIWQGWVLGDFLLIGALIPIFRWGGPPIRHWLDHLFEEPPQREPNYRRSMIVVATIIVIMVVIVLQGMAMIADSVNLSPDAVTTRGEPLLPHLKVVGLFLGLLFTVMVVTTGTFTATLARVSERHRSVALRDTLTGSYSRQAFTDIFQREADRSRRLRRGISLIYFDIDRFKPINDQHGHETGDKVLQQVVRRVRIASRDHDLLFRFGGEEFVLLMPHSDPADALALAERVRIAVAAEAILHERGRQPIWTTLSLGTAGTTHYPANPEALIRQADAACYLAKHRGRNRVAGGAELDDAGDGSEASMPA